MKRRRSRAAVNLADLVGDVIRVRLGHVAPADARLLGHVPLQADQSALTGESLPVTCGRAQVLYLRLVGGAGGGRRGGLRDRPREFLRPERWCRKRERSATSSGRCCGSAGT